MPLTCVTDWLQVNPLHPESAQRLSRLQASAGADAGTSRAAAAAEQGGASKDSQGARNESSDFDDDLDWEPSPDVDNNFGIEDEGQWLKEMVSPFASQACLLKEMPL